MRQLVVAVDGSEVSARAARFALQLAGGAKVTLVHVCPPPGLPTDEPFDQLPALLDAQRSSARRMLAALASSLAPASVEVVVRDGSAAEEVADLADALEADLVVVGRKGRGGVARMLLGSVADRLVHICRRPVLVVQ